MCISFNHLKKSLRKYLSDKQIEAINGKKVVNWDNEAVKKALLIKIRGGQRVLDYVRRCTITKLCNNQSPHKGFIILIWNSSF